MTTIKLMTQGQEVEFHEIEIHVWSDLTESPPTYTADL
jgi:hypothetical protein